MPSAIQAGGQQDWLSFARLSGQTGAFWAEEFTRSGAMELTGAIDSAVLLLRRRRFDEANRTLGGCETRIVAMGCRGAKASVLWRWYRSALAYARYCAGDLDEACKLLDQADEEVCRALEQHLFLLPLANHCYDFQLQRARVERNRFRWRQVNMNIEIGRAMLTNHRPLCVLRSGAEVYISDVDAFVRSIHAEGQGDRVAIARALDETARRQLFESFVRNIYLTAGVVIPYP